MTKVDSYPSRVKSTWQIIERQDPVVYAGNKVEYLNKEQVEFFAQNGFLLMHQVFSETEINEIQHVAKELQIQSPSEVISEPDNPEVIRSVFAVHENNQHFKALSCDSRLVKPVCQLLGSDVYIHQSRVNYKPGFEGKEFYWHSDFETWHVEDGMPRMRAISCAIFLSENYVYNGALMLVPGSHKFFISCVGETPENNYKQSLKKQVYGVPPHEALADLVDKGGIEMATGCAGSVIFFDCNTMHGSAGNITPYTRDNVFFVYNSVENTLIEPFAGTKPRPHFIASRSFNPISLANAQHQPSQIFLAYSCSILCQRYFVPRIKHLDSRKASKTFFYCIINPPLFAVEQICIDDTPFKQIPYFRKEKLYDQNVI